MMRIGHGYDVHRLVENRKLIIGGEEIPIAAVRERLGQLDRFHITYVLDCMQKTSTPIRNIRAYLLAALYQAPVTIDSYYRAAVCADRGR